jgi:hypothetical protein
MELPGESWPIWGELGRLYGEQGKLVIFRWLAERIDDEGMRGGFETAVQSILGFREEV